MLALLNPRVWIALAIVALLAFTHFTAYRSGKNNVRNEWKAAVADANIEANRLERARQSRVDAAGAAATVRAGSIAADAGRTGDALERLRSAIASRQLAEESIASAVKRANTAEQLLIEGASLLRESAASCDRIVSDRQLLLDAWPK